MAVSQKVLRVLIVGQGRPFLDSAMPLFASGRLISVGGGCRPGEMLETVLIELPDVVVVDLSMDGSAYQPIESVMAERPTPILVLREKGLDSTVDAARALELGALDVVERPAIPDDAFWGSLVRRIELVSQIRVVKHVKGSLRRRPGTVRGAEAPFPLVAIASSLGGPKALSVLLRDLPRVFPAPICICQHITEGFTDELAQWLTAETGRTVVEAEDGAILDCGRVMVAPSGAHFMVSSEWKVVLDRGAPLGGFKPSCDALLSSVAQAFGRRAIGVILTGMGRDGAAGLKEIRERGGRTIAQDEPSCTVFGMPGQAIEIGAVERVLPLAEIGTILGELVKSC